MAQVSWGTDMGMPFANTSFGPGGVANTELGREGVDIGARPDFWGDLEKMTRVMRPARTTPQAQGRALATAPNYDSGTGPILRESAGTRTDDPNPTGAGLGTHSFVKNMFGPQQTGGFVRTGFQPGAVYGGWDPTGGAGGPVSVNPSVPEYRRQFEGASPDDTAAARSFAVNASLGPSLADRQRSERMTASKPDGGGYSWQNMSQEEQKRNPARSYTGGGGRR